MQNRLGAPHPSAAMHISSLIAALGCGAPRLNGEIHICRNTGISAKSVNYFCGNMKDADFIDVYAGIREDEREAIFREITEQEDTIMLAQYIRDKGFQEGELKGWKDGRMAS